MDYIERTLRTNNNSPECCPISKSCVVSIYHP